MADFHRYFLTFCTHERRRHFINAADPVALVSDQIARASAREDVNVIVYCFVPDHLHVLVEGAREDANLKGFIKLATQGIVCLLARGVAEYVQRAG